MELYKTIPRNNYDQLLHDLSHYEVFHRKTYADYFLAYLATSKGSGPEKANMILGINKKQLAHTHIELLANRKTPAFFWKNGEFGRLLPCPVVSYRFQPENHLNDPLSRSMGRQLKNALKQPGSIFGDPDYTCSLLVTLLTHLIRLNTFFKESEQYAKSKITPKKYGIVKDYIQNNITSKILVADLARLVGQSKGYFYESFKHTAGMTPLQYITMIKIEKAKELLLYSNESVIQVGMAIGYDNPAHFSRLFKKEIGVAPLYFKKQYNRLDK